jgi:prepilin peptidase dependent protein B
MPRTLKVRRAHSTAQRGLSMIELMVGLTLGMLVVVGGISLFVNNAVTSRQLNQETRINQDLRAAVDLIARDLRRAGYWGDSLRGTVATSATSSTTTPNPYRAITTGTNQIEYNFSRDTTEDDTLGNNEQFGFRLNAGAVEMKTDSTPTWRAVTDAATLNVTSFTIASFVGPPVVVNNACSRMCCTAADVAAAVTGCTVVTLSSGSCPTVMIRQYHVTVTGTATNNSAITRSLSARVRARNDEFSGTCPA